MKEVKRHTLGSGSMSVYADYVTASDYDALLAERDELLAALEGYMFAHSLMNEALNDGVNVHGAISNFTGSEDNASAAIAKARGDV
jgi:hypothetical protein